MVMRFPAKKSAGCQESIARFPAKKRWHSPPRVGLPWGSSPPPPESVQVGHER